MLPSTGEITAWFPPEGPGIRVDSGVECGSDVSVYYDPMLAKLIVWGENRDAAIARFSLALDDFGIDGIRSNVPLLAWIARDEAYRAGDTTTRFLEERLDESIFAKNAVSDDALAFAIASRLQSGESAWRLGAVGIPFRLRGGDRVYSVDASRNSASGAWMLSGDLSGELTMRNGTFTFNGKPLQRAGAELQTAAPPSVDEASHAHTGGAAGGRIVSPMPGKIVKIAVREGDNVETHDLLVVLEAMKMEHRIEAPADGVVKRIAVREGEIVTGSAPILEIE